MKTRTPKRTLNAPRMTSKAKRIGSKMYNYNLTKEYDMAEANRGTSTITEPVEPLFQIINMITKTNSGESR